MAIAPVKRVLELLYPEVGAGGFTRVDGTIAFYQRVSALVRPEDVVLDYGAGRGKFLEDSVEYRRNLRNLRGRVARVVGVDVDPVVMLNTSLDEGAILDSGGCIPLGDSSVDVIVSDYTFEHVTNADAVAQELARVLKIGGWICCRTPNRNGLIGIPTRLVPNPLHGRVLRMVQPSKLEADTFRTAYRMNSLAKIRQLFPAPKFENYSYCFDSEPAYAGASVLAWRIWRLLTRILPPRWGSMLFVFLRRVQ